METMSIQVRLKWVVGLSVMLAATLASAVSEISLESDTALATAGYYQLRWNAPPGGIRLSESMDKKFSSSEIIYEGADTARLVSGKSDGEYFYRLETLRRPSGQESGRVSNTLRVSVQHHSLERALLFFSIGAVVFVATLGLVLFGRRFPGSRT